MIKKLKHPMRTYFFLLLTIFPFLSVAGQDSIEWQRLNLESEIEGRLHKALKPVLNEGQYVLSVNIAVNEEAVSASKDTNSDLLAKSDLPLSKLGFWTPLLKDMAEGGEAKVNIFSRIAQVDVKVILDSKVAESKRQIVDEIVSRGVQGFVSTRPVVEIAEGDLTAPAKEVARGFSDWILEFKNGISLLLAVFLGVLLLSGLGIVVAKDFTAVFRRGIESVDSYISFKKENHTAVDTSFGGGAFADDEGTKVKTTVGPVAGGAGTMVMGGIPMVEAGTQDVDGFEKFTELYKKAPDVAQSLVKKWINARGNDDAKALVVLGQRASIEELNILFGNLSVEMKRTCKRLISIPFGAEALKEGLDYMRAQVTEVYVSARPSMPESTLSLIDSLTDKEFLAIANQDFNMAAMILSASSTAKVSGLMNSIPNEVFANVSNKTAEIFEKNIASEASNIESTIQDTRSRQVKRSVFLEKSVELIPSASPEKELILYRMLLQAGDVDLVKETALKTLPSSMVTFLPSEIIQRVLTRMLPSDRAELIASQPSDRSEFLLSCLGSSGDKLRDLVDGEVDDVRLDSARLSALQEDAESMWFNIVNTLRTFQRQNPSFARSLKPVVNRWLSSLTGGSGSYGDLDNVA